MTFTEELLAIVEQKHLLKHPFYQMWENGTLPIEVMRKYSEQYYHLERNFPNFLSVMLMHTNEVDAREAIRENFNDETAGEKNHRELWLRFGECIGALRENMKNSEILPETHAAIETFLRLSGNSMIEGVAGLAAYESQIPTIAEKKLNGLRKNYGISDARGTEFFNIHGIVDKKHAYSWWRLIEKYARTEEEQSKAKEATEAGASALWNFLNGICREYMPKMECTC